MGELTKEQNSVFRDTFFHVIGHGISPDNVNKLCAALASRGLPIAPIAPVTALEVAGEKVTLAECPIGLFLSESGTLALKTEYESDEGRIDAFIVESGEFFWGAPPQSIASQRGQIVTPLAPYRKEEAGNG